jgi:hypothetical protein
VKTATGWCAGVLLTLPAYSQTQTAVDVKSSSTDTSLSTTLLASTPITRHTADLINYLPAVSDRSAFGGDAGTSSSLLLDGVETRDPEDGAAGITTLQTVVDVVRVQGLGVPASDGGFTGAVVRTITRSAPRRSSGLFDVFSTGEAFGSNNVSAAIAKANPVLTTPTATTMSIEISGHVGGPLRDDRASFFAGGQYARVDEDPAGRVTTHRETTPRFIGKISLQPNGTNAFSAQVLYGSRSAHGLTPADAPLAATDQVTSRASGRDVLWLAEWRRSSSKNRLLAVHYSGWSGSSDTTPEVNSPGRFNEDGVRTVSDGTFRSADRSRHRVAATFSSYVQRFGRHEVKFGAEFERSRSRDRYGYVDNIRFYDLGGRPHLAYSFGYDLSATTLRESAYAQDAWSVGGRLTANLGVRTDIIRGRSDGAGTVYRANDWSPRAGVAWDVTGVQRMVLKAAYSRYTEQAATALFRRALPGTNDRVTYLVNQNSSLGPEIARDPAVPYSVASNINQPRVDEVTGGLERLLGDSMRLSVVGVWRAGRNFVNSVAPLARWSPVTARNDLTGTPLALYRWVNRSASEGSYLIRNVAGFEYLDPAGRVLGTVDPERTYKAFMAVLTRRLTGRWEGQWSYVWSQAAGTVDNTAGSQAASRQFETPNLALVNAEGPLANDRTHEAKILMTYEVPRIGITIGGIGRMMSGRTYSAYQRVPNVLLNTVGLPDEYREPRVLPQGSRRLPTEATFDVRIEKRFRIRAADRLGVYLDVTNLANAGTATRVVDRYPSAVAVTATGPSAVPFETPDGLLPPRQVWLGGRWMF